MYASDGPYVRIGIRGIEFRELRLPCTLPHTYPQPENHSGSFYDNQAGADPSRTSDYRENHQKQGISRTGEAFD